VALCPPSLGLAGGIIEASTLCSRELSACCTMAVPRMLFNHRYTSPAQSVEGVGNVSKRTVAVAMFWPALAKAGRCCSARSPAMAWLPFNVDSC
jgi:hypothetical protein